MGSDRGAAPRAQGGAAAGGTSHGRAGTGQGRVRKMPARRSTGIRATGAAVLGIRATGAAVLGSAVLVVGLAGCGSITRARTPTRMAADTVSAQVLSTECTSYAPTSSSSAAAGPGTCVIQLADGRRFRCDGSSPPASAKEAQPAGDPRCHLVPAAPSKRSTPAQTAAARTAAGKAHECLRKAGIRSAVDPGQPANPRAPGAEMILGGRDAAAFVAFYGTAQAAAQALGEVSENAKHLGGLTDHRGKVTILWLHAPSMGAGARVESCVSQAHPR